MTTLTIPSLNRRFLQAVREEMAAEPIREWPERSLQLALKVFREIRASAADMRHALEEELANGVEARSFVLSYGQYLPVAEDHLAFIRELVESLSKVGDAATESLLVELRLLQQEHQTFRDLLAQALALASEPPGPIDWAQLKQESDADYAAGRSTVFATPEDMLKGLGGGD